MIIIYPDQLALRMSRILTVTFNPCIDKSTTVPALAPEKKLACSQPVFEPGGGGLNVARAIKKLGGDAIAVFTFGGHSGRFLQNLVAAEGIRGEAVEIKNATRENLIVLDTSTNQQYRFGMPGPEISGAELQQLLDLIRQHKEAEYVVVSGSLTHGVPDSIFGDIAAITKKNGARLVVDTSGKALEHAAYAGVFLLKPNLGELSALAGKEQVDEDDVDDLARSIIAKGHCEIVVVSMGAGGAQMITAKEVYRAVPPVVKRRSTVGAGDSMVAGLILCLSRGASLKEALCYGVASGTAATMNPGTELCKKEDVEKLLAIMQKKM